MCNNNTNDNNRGNLPEVISNPNEGDRESVNQEQTTDAKISQNNNQVTDSASDLNNQDEYLQNEQKQKQNSYDVSYWLTIIVIITWIAIMIIIACKINCIIASPNGWHILLFSISLLLIAFSLSGRLFRRFYPSSKSDKEEFNLHETLAKSFDKLVDKLPDLLKGKSN